MALRKAMYLVKLTETGSEEMMEILKVIQLVHSTG